MKKGNSERKLSLNKLKISKITNLQAIKGGDDTVADRNTCMFPDNGSKPKDPIVVRV